MILLPEVGAFASAPTNSGVDVQFGVYLPGIEPQDGYEVLVRVIHKDDRFVPQIGTLDFPLTPVVSSPNTLWHAQVTIPVKPGTNFGQPGTYLYRYQLLQTIPGTATQNVLTRWWTDPFARATDDMGELSAFVTPGSVTDLMWTDDAWKVPELEDLVVYELHVEEFNRTFDGVIERLPYLKSLGVTCHQAGIAVILDVVYQHVDATFPYHLVYENAGLPSPMISGVGPFGPEIDYRLQPGVCPRVCPGGELALVVRVACGRVPLRRSHRSLRRAYRDEVRQNRLRCV
jgi:maltooligosyltrehalose trehalohydrolase